jgi:hypothetical protein
MIARMHPKTHSWSCWFSTANAFGLFAVMLFLCATCTASTRGVNYASAYLGAKIVDHHPLADGAQNLLKEDPEKYMIVPCRAERKAFTFGLSKEIEVHAISLLNLEYFSSSIRNFTLLGSRTYPCKPPQCSWRVLGSFTAKHSRGLQHFAVPRKPPVRFVRLLWVTHQGVEQSCTLTSIQVFGSDVLEALVAELADQYEEHEYEAANNHHHQQQQQHHHHGNNHPHQPHQQQASPLSSSMSAKIIPNHNDSGGGSSGNTLLESASAVGGGGAVMQQLPATMRQYLQQHPFASPACNGTWCVELLMRYWTCPLPKPKSAPLTVLNRQLHSLQSDISRLQKLVSEQRSQVERLKASIAGKAALVDENVTELKQALTTIQRRVTQAEYEIAAVRELAENTSSSAPQLVAWIILSNILALLALVSVVSGRVVLDNSQDKKFD